MFKRRAAPAADTRRADNTSLFLFTNPVTGAVDKDAADRAAAGKLDPLDHFKAYTPSYEKFPPVTSGAESVALSARLDYTDADFERYTAEVAAMTTAVLAGTFSVGSLTESRAWKVAIARHKQVQENSSMRTNNGIAYQPIPFNPEHMMTLTDGAAWDAATPESARHDVMWWLPDSGRPGTSAEGWNAFVAEGVRIMPMTHMALEFQAPWQQQRQHVTPVSDNWALMTDKSGSVNNGRSAFVDRTLFWSAAVLYRATGSTGVRVWDEGMQDLIRERTGCDPPVIPPDPVAYHGLVRCYKPGVGFNFPYGFENPKALCEVAISRAGKGRAELRYNCGGGVLRRGNVALAAALSDERLAWHSADVLAVQRLFEMARALKVKKLAFQTQSRMLALTLAGDKGPTQLDATCEGPAALHARTVAGAGGRRWLLSCSPLKVLYSRLLEELQSDPSRRLQACFCSCAKSDWLENEFADFERWRADGYYQALLHGGSPWDSARALVTFQDHAMAGDCRDHSEHRMVTVQLPCGPVSAPNYVLFREWFRDYSLEEVLHYVAWALAADLEAMLEPVRLSREDPHMFWACLYHFGSVGAAAKEARRGEGWVTQALTRAPPGTAAQALKAEGNKCYVAGKYDAAVNFYSCALAAMLEGAPGKDSLARTLHTNSATAWYKAGRFRDALSAASQALAVGGVRHHKALLRRAQAQLQRVPELVAAGEAAAAAGAVEDSARALMLADWRPAEGASLREALWVLTGRGGPNE